MIQCLILAEANINYIDPYPRYDFHIAYGMVLRAIFGTFPARFRSIILYWDD